MIDLLLNREGGRGGDNRNVVVAGLSFPFSKFLVSLREEEKAIRCSGGNAGGLR